MHHRSRPAALTLLMACLAFTPAVLADDVVHFQNGTFMKVQGYTVEGDTIKVTLSPGASMSFPKNLVESIERAGRTVYPQTSSAPANVVVSGSAGGQVSSSQYLQRGVDQVPASARAALGMTPSRPEGTAADKDEAVPDRHEFQLGNGRPPLRALGRRAGPVGEGLVEKDSHAPPPQVARPRAFTSLSPKGMPTAPVPPAPETVPPTEPPPPEETPDDPPVEEDGGN